MHPLLAHRGRTGPYLLAWIPVAALLAVAFHLAAGSPWLEAGVLSAPLTLVYAFICLGAWYPCRATAPGRSGVARIVATQGAAAILSVFGWVLIAATWAALLGSFPAFARTSERMPRVSAVLTAAGLVLYTLAAALHYLLAAFEEARRAERQALELEVLAREAELRALRAQVDPHFLFNALNSIASLIGSDAAVAREMCVLLGDFLREALRVGREREVALADELALVERYLAIERARFGARLRFSCEAAGPARACAVPPLLLQPLVENALRHGITGLIEGGEVRLSARTQGERLIVRVENPVDPEAPRRAGDGLGLNSVRERLATLHGGRAEVVVEDGPARFSVTLSLPAVAVASAAPV